ncbi:MAG: CFI-box-CTERM domain-containing protein [Candidatus Sericytochromatia bacterium]|nr:CFI-box-CTERM domain-containing protein [Candidatus Sericytochromatia bacterium]
MTFHLQAKGQPGGDWAVRCFHAEVPGGQQRNEAISHFLRMARSAYFEGFDYQPRGIRVNGQHYPIVKMGWLKGKTLGLHVDGLVGNAAALRRLAEDFRQAVEALGQLGAAHGDLQHGNIMVVDDTLRLIDYDGMFVPGMARGNGSERGHVNYQHPQRDGAHFGPEMDRFSAIIIYTSLLALACDQNLWRFNTGENLVLSAADFIHPDASPALREFQALARQEPCLKDVVRVCKLPIDKLPTLPEFLAGQISNETIQLQVSRYARQYEGIWATDVAALLAREGRTIELFGLVVEVSQKLTRTRESRPYIFITFGNWRRGPVFRLVMWSEGLEHLDCDPQALVGKWVTVTGLAQRYQDTPQIVLEHPAQLRVLAGGETEAQQLKDGLLAPGQGERSPFWRWKQGPGDADKMRERGETNAPRSSSGQAPRAGLNEAITFGTKASLANLRGPESPNAQIHFGTPSQPAKTSNAKRPSAPAPGVPAPAPAAKPADSGCFIATAAYGCSEMREVQRLRRWRDEVLAHHAAGRLFVRFYYRVSPPIASWVATSELRRAGVRAALRQLLRWLPG